MENFVANIKNEIRYNKKKIKINSNFIVTFCSIIGLAISFCALLISNLAFKTTHRSAELDEEYKEVSIRPFLNTYTDLTDMSWTFENTGIGPALITEMAFIGPGFCMASNGKSKYTDPQIRVNQIIRKDVESKFQELLPIEVKSKNPISLTFSHDLRELREIHSVGKPVKLFKVRSFPDEIERSIKTQFRIEINDYARYAFKLTIEKYNFLLGYCSLTEKWCENLNIDEKCTRE